VFQGAADLVSSSVIRRMKPNMFKANFYTYMQGKHSQRVYEAAHYQQLEL
jgi:hypothetical protein